MAHIIVCRACMCVSGGDRGPCFGPGHLSKPVGGCWLLARPAVSCLHRERRSKTSFFVPSHICGPLCSCMQTRTHCQTVCVYVCMRVCVFGREKGQFHKPLIVTKSLLNFLFFFFNKGCVNMWHVYVLSTLTSWSVQCKAANWYKHLTEQAGDSQQGWLAAEQVLMVLQNIQTSKKQRCMLVRLGWRQISWNEWF